MMVGTKSVLFGVHAFWYHPWTVALAWRMLYGRWPRWHEWIAIFTHDANYWGKPNIDGPEGKLHPYGGAWIAARIVGFFRGEFIDTDTYWLTVLHSRDVAEYCGQEPSALCAADKASIFFDPDWFYILRGRLSGEMTEFKSYAIEHGDLPANVSDEAWLAFYRANVKSRPEIAALL